MNGAPWWVPLGAAGIALLGVVIGQSLGAWIEARRQRQDVQRRTFEHWRDKKLELYSSFIQTIHIWLMSNAQIGSILEYLSRVSKDKDAKNEALEHATSIATKLEEQIESLAKTVRDLVTILLNSGLVASTEWESLARKALDEIFRAYDVLTKMTIKLKTSEQITSNDLTTHLINIRKHVESLQKVARMELDISAR